MSPSSPNKRFFFVFLAFFALAAGPGCQELDARRNVQKANKLYYEGRYSKAAELYQKALDLAPDLVIGHHNAAINYYKLFIPGDPSEQNQEIARQAAHHFQAYLEAVGDDSKIIDLLTRIWTNSGQHEKALAYWKQELSEDPSNRDVLRKLADINKDAGEHEKALEWLRRVVEAETTDEGKVQGYYTMAELQWSRLTHKDVVDLERLQIADSGLAALQKALEIDPQNANVHSLMAAIYQRRATAHGATWARYLDAASQRHHQLRRKEIAEASEEGGEADGAEPSNQPEKE